MLITNYQSHLFALTFTQSYATSKRWSLRICCTAVDFFSSLSSLVFTYSPTRWWNVTKTIVRVVRPLSLFTCSSDSPTSVIVVDEAIGLALYHLLHNRRNRRFSHRLRWLFPPAEQVIPKYLHVFRCTRAHDTNRIIIYYISITIIILLYSCAYKKYLCM